MKAIRMLNNPEFWIKFENDVIVKQCWACPDLNIDLLKETEKLENSKLRERREKAIQLKNNPSNWAELIILATKHIAGLEISDLSKEVIQTLEMNHLMNPFEDYIVHLHYFEIVSDLMKLKGLGFDPQSQSNSVIHDIDKFDPVMLTSYADRFEDGLETKLWEICVKRHVTNSLHHQDHPDWIKYDPNDNNTRMTNAIREMVCDKVSRGLQKELGGQINPVMWDIDSKWFGILPSQWIKEARKILNEMK